ncbi:hypothetical protein JCM10213v2_002771 [Rhodosporidiobolus nylandii]
MLDAALHGRLSSGLSPSLIVLTDSLMQPALPLSREFVRAALSPRPSASTSSAARTAAQGVVLLCAEQSPHKLLPPTGSYDPERVAVVHFSSAGPSFPPLPVASTSNALPPYAHESTVDIDKQGALAEIEAAVEKAVEAAGGKDGGILVVLDGVQELEQELPGGSGAVGRVVKGVLKKLSARKGSRLLVSHHSDLPSPPPSAPSLAQPSLLSLLLSPSLSTSALHLSLRPTSHVELLAREYGLAVPLSLGEGEPEELDLRMGQFLASLAQRAVGDPLRRPEGPKEDDERLPLDALCSRAGDGREGLALSAGGSCIVEYSARGLDVSAPVWSGAAAAKAKALERERERERSARGEVKKLVRYGFVSVRASRDEKGTVRVRETPLREVLDAGRCGRRRGGGELSPLPTPTTTPSASSRPSPSTATSQEAPLTFSLSLTPSQAHARAAVVNPFANARGPIFGEEGYVAPLLPSGEGWTGEREARGEGKVEYTPDEGDDWDEEDPDEDLEI